MRSKSYSPSPSHQPWQPDPGVIQLHIISLWMSTPAAAKSRQERWISSSEAYGSGIMAMPYTGRPLTCSVGAPLCSRTTASSGSVRGVISGRRRS